MNKQKYKEIKQEQRSKEYQITGKCTQCGKEMWERDREYSVHKFGSTYCAPHTPDMTVDGHVNTHRTKGGGKV